MKSVSLCLIAISISVMLHAQESFTSNRNVVQQTVISMFEALSNRDAASLKHYCTGDISLYEYGQVWNMDTLILKAITQNPSADFKRINTFEFIHTAEDKNTAWVTYRLQSVITRDGKQGTLQWLETAILVKEKKQWKIRHLHSTLIRRT